MKSHRLPDAECPGCGRKLDAARNADRGLKSRPKPGDLTICFYCTAYLEFQEGGSYRLISKAEFQTIHPANQKVLAAMRQAIIHNAP